MIREAIAKGDTVEQAFASACQELGVDTTEAEFEILEMPQKKTFGLFGGAPARVRAYIEVPGSRAGSSGSRGCGPCCRKRQGSCRAGSGLFEERAGGHGPAGRGSGNSSRGGRR